MRVLMLSWEFPPNLVGGLSRHVDNLSRALVGRGVEVDVLTTSYPGAPPLEEIGGVRVHRVPPYFSNAPDFPSWVMHANFGFLEEGARLVGANGPADLVHAHDWLVTYAARGLKHLYQVPLVATIHATEHGRHNGVHSPQQKYINDIEWWLTYEAWRVISCSRYMKDEVRRLFGLPEDKVRVVPNGVNLPVEPRKTDGVDGTAPRAVDPSKQAAGPRPRSRFAHPAEKIIFHVGRLVPEKGAGLLLEALPMILAA
ncbi:MAG: glycosyltransferase family 4 protein, partial [Actinobacteria bacterium]|nr:glycosyltransferase family 4 protein [Actinomycetota bacterium]